MRITTKARTPEEIRAAAERHSQFLNVVYGSMMDLTDSLMRDAIDEMRRQGTLRREVKRETGLALQAIKKLLDILRINTSGHRMLYLDLLDVVQDSVSQDILKLHFAVKQVLDRHKIDRSEMMTRIEVTHAMLHLAARSFDVVCQEGTDEYHMPFHRLFSALNPQGALARWTNVCHMACRYPEGINAAISNDQNIANGMKILLLKLTDMNLMEQHCITALSQHEDLKADYLARHPEYEFKTS